MGAVEQYLLFCSTGLGDSLFCTPAIRFLRRQRPRCRIRVVIKNKLGDLFDTNPHIDELMSYSNNPLSIAWARRRIRRQGLYRAVFFFHVGDEVLQLIRGAAYERLHSIRPFHPNPERFHLFPIDIAHKRQWEDFADMVASECGGQNSDPSLELPLSPESRAFADAFYRGFANCKRPWIGIQLGGSHLGKCWPPERYAVVAARLLERYDGAMFINAPPSEQSLWEQFHRRLPTPFQARCQRLPATGVNGLAALLAALDLVLSNDTGPLHVALSQDRPVVALKAHDDQTYPYTLPRETPLRRSLFVRTQVPTSGKGYHQSHRAMECIPTEAVVQEVESVLARLSYQPRT